MSDILQFPKSQRNQQDEETCKEDEISPSKFMDISVNFGIDFLHQLNNCDIIDIDKCGVETDLVLISEVVRAIILKNNGEHHVLFDLLAESLDEWSEEE